MPTELPQKFVESQWKPGQSGNPAGRPLRPSFEALVASILDEKIEATMPDGQKAEATKREMVARVFVDALLKKHPMMLREFLTRMWPAVEYHDVNVAQGAGTGAVLDKLARIAALKRANGGDPEPGPERADDGDGADA